MLDWKGIKNLPWKAGSLLIRARWLSRRRRGTRRRLGLHRNKARVRWDRACPQDCVPCIPQENEARQSGDAPLLGLLRHELLQSMTDLS